MKESRRIQKLFTDAYNGDPWLDVTLMATLNSLTSVEAAKRILPNCNTIWEITNHIISWRENVLKRIQGEIIQTPQHNYIIPISDTSETAWQQTLLNLKVSQEKWIEYLKTFEEENFNKEYPTNKMTYYEHIHGILHHDAYHLGQIVLLAKLSKTNS